MPSSSRPRSAWMSASASTSLADICSEGSAASSASCTAVRRDVRPESPAPAATAAEPASRMASIEARFAVGATEGTSSRSADSTATPGRTPSSF